MCIGSGPAVINLRLLTRGYRGFRATQATLQGSIGASRAMHGNRAIGAFRNIQGTNQELQGVH